MNTDRELLELAAKAAGIEIYFDDDGDCYRVKASSNRHYWNPIAFDGDAFRLLIDLRLIVTQYTAGLTVHQYGPVIADVAYAKYDGDRRAAARRAITLAAAAIAPKEAS